jgi:GNAT superfamily N-acetyltransferase
MNLIDFAGTEHTVLGMVNLLFTVSTALGGRVGILEDLIVAPGSRGSGIGSALLKKAIEKARALGCKRLALLTDRDNRSAHRLYRRHGFVMSQMAPFQLSLEQAD